MMPSIQKFFSRDSEQIARTKPSWTWLKSGFFRSDAHRVRVDSVSRPDIPIGNTVFHTVLLSTSQEPLEPWTPSLPGASEMREYSIARCRGIVPLRHSVEGFQESGRKEFPVSVLKFPFFRTECCASSSRRGNAGSCSPASCRSSCRGSEGSLTCCERTRHER